MQSTAMSPRSIKKDSSVHAEGLAETQETPETHSEASQDSLDAFAREVEKRIKNKKIESMVRDLEHRTIQNEAKTARVLQSLIDLIDVQPSPTVTTQDLILPPEKTTSLEDQISALNQKVDHITKTQAELAQSQHEKPVPSDSLVAHLARIETTLDTIKNDFSKNAPLKNYNPFVPIFDEKKDPPLHDLHLDPYVLEGLTRKIEDVRENLQFPPSDNPKTYQNIRDTLHEAMEKLRTAQLSVEDFQAASQVLHALSKEITQGSPSSFDQDKLARMHAALDRLITKLDQQKAPPPAHSPASPLAEMFMQLENRLQQVGITITEELSPHFEATMRELASLLTETHTLKSQMQVVETKLEESQKYRNDSLQTIEKKVENSLSILSNIHTQQAAWDQKAEAYFGALQERLETLAQGSTSPKMPAQQANSPDIKPPQPMVDGSIFTKTGKITEINTHIAAARRAAIQALQNHENTQNHKKNPAYSSANSHSVMSGITAYFSGLAPHHYRPMLIGVAAVSVLAMSVVAFERRSHNSANILAVAESTKAPVDMSATGSLPASQVAPVKDKMIEDLIAALPAKLDPALIHAARTGNLSAQIDIGMRFFEGRGVTRDYAVAAQWLQVAADKGNAFAQDRLAILYEQGAGVPHLPAHAKALYRKAAEAGNTHAMHGLGVLLYQNTSENKPDYAAAVFWFERAASYGVRDSQFNLGMLYERGLGAPQDLAESWMWFSVAARQGDVEAARKRDDLINQIDGRVLELAQKRLAAFRQQTPDLSVNTAPPLPVAFKG